MPTQNRYSFPIVATLLLLICSYVFTSTKSELRSLRTRDQIVEQPPLYLPDPKYVRLITFGFDNFFADILWFNTINYFGKQYRAGKDYRWLTHMCTVTSELDPKALHLYEFCATMLSWMAKQPEASVSLLSRGIEQLPNRWRLRFLRGFNYWYFMGKPEKAAEDFRIAATLSEAPPFLSSLASRLMSHTEGPESAVIFLDEMIRNARDGVEREALIEKRKLAQISLAKKQLQQSIALYQQKTGKKLQDLEELFKSGFLKGNLIDPFGGSYYLDKNTGEIETTSGKAGLSFSGKTAKTGLAASEWEDNGGKKDSQD